jgi:hypothetical protein
MWRQFCKVTVEPPLSNLIHESIQLFIEWEAHDDWAERPDISAEVSREVNNQIDDHKDTGLNSEFKQNTRLYVPGSSAMSHVIAERAPRHDSGRTQKSDAKMYANAKLNLLKEHSEDHVTAYYLHHLDYFDEEWNPEKDVDGLVKEFRSKYRHLVSEVIEQFIR